MGKYKILEHLFGLLDICYYLCIQRIITMTEEPELGFEIFEEEGDGLSFMVAEPVSRDIVEQLADLHTLKGAGFITMLKEITQNIAFSPLESDGNIYTTGGAKDDDYDNLLNVARKAVEHDYRVYILPNPKGFRTADFIFERKGVYKMFDLKTISGKNSVENRLSESIGQTNRVLLHMTVDYSPSTLARSIKRYFETNLNAREVLVFKGRKQLSVTRKSLEDNRFFQTFIRRYIK